MLIIPDLRDDGSLTLDAYSFTEREIQAVERTLLMAQAQFEAEHRAPDNRGRDGRRFTLGPEAVLRLRQQLNLDFARRANVTVAECGPAGGREYKCEEIALMGAGSGCADFDADGGQIN